MEQKPSFEMPQDIGFPSQQSSSKEKLLDYNAPLLSVRRLNEQGTVHGNGRVPPVPKKYFKLSSELSAESLRKPGAVPFMWEQTPGKPKMKGNKEARYSPQPAPPPGRSSPAMLAPLERGSHNISSESCNNLEQQIFSEHDMDAIDQKQSEGSDNYSEQSSAKFAAMQLNGSGAFRRASSLKITIPLGQSRLAAKPQNCSPQRSSENDDILSAYTERMPPSDALATSCRVSMDEHDGSKFLTHTGREARDFIMCRFLPAAKAMACDALPRVQSRRPMLETSSSIVKRRPLPLTPRQPPFLARETESSAEEDDEPEGSSKVCGLIPSRFRTIFLHLNRSPRNSSRPTTKDKGPSSLSRSRKLGTMIYKDASSDTDDEDVVAREVQASLRQRRLESKSCRYCAASTWITSECSGSPLNHQYVPEGGETPSYNSLFYDAVSMFSPQTTDRSGSCCVSPFRNGKSTYPFNEAKGFLGLPNERRNTAVYADATSPRAPVSDAFTGRKISHSPARRGHGISDQIGGEVLCADMFDHSRMKSSFPQKIAAAENGSGVLYKHETSDELQEYLDESTTLESVQTVDYKRVGNSFSISNEWQKGERTSGSNSDVCTHNNRLKTWSASKQKGWPFGISGKLSVASPREKACVDTADSALDALSPPLPKSPTESWLLKTLPSKGSKSSSLPMSNLGTATIKYQLGSLSGPAARWEILVKGSHVQPGHLRFSEELLHGSSNCTESGQP
eukprot:c27662_g1_i2 orf=627-2831(+)